MKTETLEVKPINPKLSLKEKSNPALTEGYLTESVKGIYLNENHAKMVWQGNKDLIVKEKKYSDVIGKSYYLISNNKCYAVIKIEHLREIDLEQFKKLEEHHRITDNEINEWFPGKKKLFAYNFTVTKSFNPPKKVAVPEGVDCFMDSVEFLSEKETEIKAEEKPKTLVESLDNLVLVDNFVSFIGSSLDGKTENGIDLLLKIDKPSFFEMFESKLEKSLKEHCNGKDVRFMCLDEDRPQYDFMPIYDLVLVKRDNPAVIGFKEIIKPLSAFHPMRLSKKFYDVNLVIREMFGG